MANKAKPKATARLSIEVESPTLLRALAAEAEERGRSVQEILEEVLDDWVRKWELYEMNKAGRSLMDLPLEERRKYFGVDKAPTEKELEARRESSKRAAKLREEIGPIDIPVDDLIHMDDEELIAKYGYGSK